MNFDDLKKEMMVDQQPFPRSVDAAPIGIDWEDNEDDQELGVLFLEADDERSPPIGHTVNTLSILRRPDRLRQKIDHASPTT